MPVKEECLCPQVCDCENPPPDDWDGQNGAYATSLECPVHNDFPRPNPGCPIHGGMSPQEFAIAKADDDPYADFD